MCKKHYLSPKVQEQMFQDAFDNWEKSGYTSKKDWDIMFLRVYEASKAAVLKACNGLYRPQALDAIEEFTIYIMGRIKEQHFRPKVLRSYCGFAPKWMIKKSEQFWDSTLDFDNEVEYAACDILGNRIEDYRRKNFEEVRLPHEKEWDY